MSLFCSSSKTPSFLLKTLTVSTALIMSAALTACGGGDGSSSSESQSTGPVNPPDNNFGSYSLKGDIAKSVQVGQPIGLLALQNQAKEADRYEWQVVSGNASKVQISANHQPASSFTFLAPGTYKIRFSAQIRNDYNQLQTIAVQTYQVTVSPAPSTTGSTSTRVAALRADRAARSGGSASLYFDVGSALSSDEWTIRQVLGPAAQMSKDEQTPLVQISLPTTDKEQILAFEATLNGDPSIKDTAYILLRPTINSASGYFCASPTSGTYCLSTTALNHHYAYKADSPVADSLVECVMSYRVNDEGICNLAYLPFIGQVTTDPTIDDIMDRVVVSHDWMAQNFEQFLRQYDKNDDFKRLLRSTTAIVISDNVKPSFYWGGTGTMYLSADYLWMTPEQRDTLTESVDFRSGFAQSFDYVFDFDYERDNQSVLFNRDYMPDRQDRASRSLKTIAMPLASLLYHELAHANDYFSQQTLKQTDGYNVNQMIKLAPYELIGNGTVSDNLAKSYPLNNAMLSGLAQVWYGGAAPTKTQLSYSGQQVADGFFADRASDDYAYFVTQEDVAMMFEEAMMLTRFGINRYIAVMDISDQSQGIPKVIRGQKNRITAPEINSRANYVVSQILPEATMSVSQALDGKRPVELCKGMTYFEYYDTDCSGARSMLPKSMKYRQLAQQHKVDELGRPIGAPRHQTPHVSIPYDIIKR